MLHDILHGLFLFFFEGLHFGGKACLLLFGGEALSFSLLCNFVSFFLGGESSGFGLGLFLSRRSGCLKSGLLLGCDPLSFSLGGSSLSLSGLNLCLEGCDFVRFFLSGGNSGCLSLGSCDLGGLGLLGEFVGSGQSFFSGKFGSLCCGFGLSNFSCLRFKSGGTSCLGFSSSFLGGFSLLFCESLSVLSLHGNSLRLVSSHVHSLFS